MIALHCSILDNTPWLWLEQGRRTTLLANGKESVLSKHGFLQSVSELAKTLPGVLPDMETTRGQCAKHVAWLPSADGKALPSSPLLGDVPTKDNTVTLQPVAVAARRLGLDEFLELCSLVASDGVRPRGVLPGASLTWSRELLRFALDLVRRGRMLPGLVREDERWCARWQAVLDGQDHTIRLDLERRMPASLRCLAADGTAAPSISPGDVLDSLLHRTVDWLMRDPLELQDTIRERASFDSPHDAWMTSLRSPSAELRWPSDDDLIAFAAELERWKRPLLLTTMSPFVFGFRLREPEENDGGHVDGNWHLEFLVRPREDPGLLLPLSSIWRSKSKNAKRLQSFGAELTEFLLVAPARAAALFPAMKRGLRGTRPTGLTLDGNEVIGFLREHAPLLEQSGFDILYPTWWTRRGAKRRIALHASVSAPKSDAPSAFSLNALLDFDIQASIGDEKLSLDELYALADMKAPLVLLRGQWTHIDQKELHSVIARLEQHGSGVISARDAVKLSLGAGSPINGLHLEGAELRGWIADLATRLSGAERLEALEVPASFDGTLRPYQLRGYSWMAFLRQWGFGACLADDMGLGKTVQTLAMLERERAAGEDRPVLLVCPTTVVTNWVKEAARFAPALKLLVHHGPGRHRARQFQREAKRSNLVVSSYGLLHRDIDHLKSIPWAGIILDEAQNIKNPETKQSRAARSLPADYRLALTGTPVENSVGDLWALMEFLNPGLLGTQNGFRNRFQLPIQKWGDDAAATQLRRITAPFILRREKTDKSIISDLPDKILMKEYCPLTKEQATLYGAVVRNLEQGLGEKEGMDRRGLILGALMRLKQICNHPAQYLGDGSEWRGRSGKLHRLFDIVNEVRNAREHVLVFTQFMEMGMVLRNALQEELAEEVFFIHGGVPRKQRDIMVERFQSDERAPTVFVLSVKAGGTGLTLTRANHVVHYDRWWNPAVENQATDRAFRIGQRKNVQVHTFIVPGTLEERIDEVLERKSDIANNVVGSGEQWLTELSDGKLLDLVRLGVDAGMEED